LRKNLENSSKMPFLSGLANFAATQYSCPEDADSAGKKVSRFSLSGDDFPPYHA
jgi:hypothetical protein